MSRRLLLGVMVVLAAVMFVTADRPAVQSSERTRHIDSLSVFATRIAAGRDGCVAAAAVDGDQTVAVDLMREGLETLEEGFAEEQLCAAERDVAATLIDRLEF